MKCSICDFCVQIGTTHGMSEDDGGKDLKMYFCEHPDTKPWEPETKRPFVGYGELDSTVPMITTAPRWCPERPKNLEVKEK